MLKTLLLISVCISSHSAYCSTNLRLTNPDLLVPVVSSTSSILSPRLGMLVYDDKQDRLFLSSPGLKAWVPVAFGPKSPNAFLRLNTVSAGSVCSLRSAFQNVDSQIGEGTDYQYTRDATNGDKIKILSPGYYHIALAGYDSFLIVALNTSACTSYPLGSEVLTQRLSSYATGSLNVVSTTVYLKTDDEIRIFSKGTSNPKPATEQFVFTRVR